MADDPSTGGHERERIDVGQPHEVDWWTQKFDVSPDELRAAVAAVGTEARKVEVFLKRHKVGDTGTAS